MMKKNENMNKDDIKLWVNNLKSELGHGYFMASINNFTCYFYYNYSKNEVLVLLSSRLKLKEFKTFLEKKGKKITEHNRSKNMILDKYNSFVKSSINFNVEQEKGVYRVEDHQLAFVAEQCKNLYKNGFIQFIDQNELEKTMSNTPTRDKQKKQINKP